MVAHERITKPRTLLSDAKPSSLSDLPAFLGPRSKERFEKLSYPQEKCMMGTLGLNQVSVELCSAYAMKIRCFQRVYFESAGRRM